VNALNKESESSGAEKFTGLILLAGKDSPGITEKLYQTLAPFSIQILDVEQVVIRDRLILTTLIALDPAHSGAIEDDLVKMAGKSGLDLAIDFADIATQNYSKTSEVLIAVLSNHFTPSQLAQVAKKIADLNGNIDRIQRTATHPVTAISIEVSFNTTQGIAKGDLISRLRDELAKVASESGIDIAVENNGLIRRAKRIVMLDMDSTLIQQEVIDLIAEKAGVGGRVAQITERAMRGELDFAESLRERVALLADCDESILDEVKRDLVLTPGARTLIRTLHKMGHKVGVVSGGFLNVIEELLNELHIDFYRANTLEISEGKLTGRLTGEIIDREAKARALASFAEREGVSLAATVAIGDGANDLGMIALAGLGIAFNAKPSVVKAADSAITTPYLDSVLYLMGISHDEVEEASAGLP
jgi:phosphoserine phosphatase